MSDLFSSLSLAARGLAAQQAGLNTAGQNIANVNTPGYTRRVVQMSATPPVDATSAGSGVDVTGVRSARADLLEGQLRHEQPTQGREAAMADALSHVETALGRPGDSIDASLTRFYNAFSQLAQDPTSGVIRQTVVVQGQQLSSAFKDLSARLTAAQHDADAQVKSGVDQINALTAEIASLNGSLSAAGGSSAEGLRDKLGVALDSLSQLIDIGVVTRADGGVDVTVGNGHSIVIGNVGYPIGVTPLAANGLAELSSGGAVITGQITGGRVGGYLQVRDGLIPGYLNQLDQLAYGVATSVNTAHRAGFDLAGTAGVDFFVPPAGVAGAANTMTVSAAIVADPSLIAAATTPNPGDNQNANAIARLQHTALGAGGTNPVDSWGALVYRVGTDSQTAKTERAGHDEIVKQLKTLRDQVSAVSLDEEAVSLTKFQRAYEANARFFSAIQTSLDVLMQLVH